MSQACLGVYLLAVSQLAVAGSITLDFEGFADSTSLTSQYPGFLFSGSNILTAGLSLNDLEYPPRSGANVAGNSGGPITILFTVPVLTFGGYFTYSSALTVEAFDSLNQSIGTASSGFTSNFVSSGNTPNEHLQLSFVGGISNITISGTSFTLDDLTVTTPDITSVPEPASGVLILSGLIACVYYRRK